MTPGRISPSDVLPHEHISPVKLTRADSTPADLVLPLPPLVKHLWKAHKSVVDHYQHTGLRFTLDGRLVGDIGEAVALEWFDLEPCEKRTGGVDALVRGTRQTVQVKATGNPGSGPSFSPGKSVADLLLFMYLDFANGTASVVYNGPEAPVRACLSRPPVRHTVTARLPDVRRLAGAAPQCAADRVPLRQKAARQAA